MIGEDATCNLTIKVDTGKGDGSLYTFKARDVDIFANGRVRGLGILVVTPY